VRCATALTLELKRGIDLLNERSDMVRLTTGNADLDSLLGGGVEPGNFYLFYGSEDSGIDLLIHRLVVNCLLQEQRYGFDGKCLYSNCGNYRLERTLFDAQLLTFLIKAAGLDVTEALDRIKVVCSFSEEQEQGSVEEIQKALEQDEEIKLVVVHNIAKLFTSEEGTPNRDSGERIARLQRVIGNLWQVCAQKKVALVASCRPKEASRGSIPKPEGGNYLRHRANVIVYLRERGSSFFTAYLRKHPNRAPRKVEFTLGGDEMGRVTKPFRMAMEEELSRLKRSFKEVLLEPGRREAFDSLVRVWSSEQGAMSYAKIPTVLDVMLLTGLVDNRRLIEELYDRFGILESKIEELISQLKVLVPSVSQAK